jgi:hypothetical protein
VLLTDTLHLNSRAAGLVADLIEAFVLEDASADSIRARETPVT